MLGLFSKTVIPELGAIYFEELKWGTVLDYLIAIPKDKIESVYLHAQHACIFHDSRGLDFVADENSIMVNNLGVVYCGRVIFKMEPDKIEIKREETYSYGGSTLSTFRLKLKR
jgi:hypothetical protein